MENKIDELENEVLNKDKDLSKTKIQLDKTTQLDKLIKVDIELLEDFEPTQVKAIINLITNIERQIIEDSLTIRVVEWIAHRDWAVRSLKILKANLQKILKEIKKAPKT